MHFHVNDKQWLIFDLLVYAHGKSFSHIGADGSSKPHFYRAAGQPLSMRYLELILSTVTDNWCRNVPDPENEPVILNVRLYTLPTTNLIGMYFCGIYFWLWFGHIHLTIT